MATIKQGSLERSWGRERARPLNLVAITTGVGAVFGDASESEPSGGGPSLPAAVWIEHRHHPRLMFRVELDAAGRVVGFTVRPKVLRTEVRSGAAVVNVPWKKAKFRNSEAAGVSVAGYSLETVEADPDSIPEGDLQPLTVGYMRGPEMPYHDVFEAARRAFRTRLRWVPSDEFDEVLRGRVGPGSASPIERARQAVDYEEVYRDRAKRSTDRTEELATRWRKSPATVPGIVRQLRADRYLSSTTKGVPRGVATNKSLRLLGLPSAGAE